DQAEGRLEERLEVHPHRERVMFARFGTNKNMAHENRMRRVGAHPFIPARRVEISELAPQLIARKVLLITSQHWQVPYPRTPVPASRSGGQPHGLAA
ncbi:hypothetical protein OIV36_31950, partial [Burkholderia pseudomallei]|uniref:hypothetical protein n=1 Tax=Burkholderia pseudomallei TaxID=28450 RepID=UPI0021F71C2B